MRTYLLKNLRIPYPLDVVKFLAVSEILTGGITAGEMTTKGFGYRSFRMKAKLKGGWILVEKAVLDGRQMTVTTAGKHDLRNGRMDLSLLVAPLKTVDRVLEDIPGADVLDIIPIGVKGIFPNLHIHPLAPSAIGYELHKLTEDTLSVTGGSSISGKSSSMGRKRCT